KVARGGGAVIVHPQIDGRNPATGLPHHRPVSTEIDERGEHAAVSVAAVRIDDPFLAPGRHQLNALVAHSDHFQAQPLVERRAGQEFLDFSQRDFFAHRIDWFLLSRDSAMKNIPIDSASRGDVSLPLPGCEEGSGDGSAATLSLSRSLLTPLHPTA